MKAHDEMDEAEALLEDWALLFPPDLSDEAAAALSQFVTALSSLMESRYGRQISHSRHYPLKRRKSPSDGNHPARDSHRCPALLWGRVLAERPWDNPVVSTSNSSGHST